MADWANLDPSHPLAKFAEALPGILETAGYSEMYGVELKAAAEGQSTPHTTLLILQKFLRANANDIPKAQEQLTSALSWRKAYNPLAAKNEVFSSAKFSSLGFVTKLHDATETPNDEDVATFNIYGVAAKNPKLAFGDTDAFIRWRVALMELTLAELNLMSATKSIPDYGQGPDPYQAIQVHDYLSVSFFRQPGEIKASSAKIIETFSKYYPETVSFKYFVNVPLVMQWMMGAMKALVSRDAVKKMTWMTYGSELFKYLGKGVPKEYGGEGPELEGSAITPKYDGGDGVEGSAPPAGTGTPAPAPSNKPATEFKADARAATEDAAEPTPELQTTEAKKVEEGTPEVKVT
ncbi:CRAL/TRIO domain-containing protein [Polychaeton citri CBS 116435]|uniref:Phosphatidylinositol transfer protein SFH5 n=1 Tax=Polychaeton citri CBS 116435 TaxID=1314669 RepID=A0A9P4PZS2_9PEZI|nr:CRAL/TRIO domain-containing protein [Polychaeton citri CBS 116435]